MTKLFSVTKGYKINKSNFKPHEILLQQFVTQWKYFNLPQHKTLTAFICHVSVTLYITTVKFTIVIQISDTNNAKINKTPITEIYTAYADQSAGKLMCTSTMMRINIISALYSNQSNSIYNIYYSITLVSVTFSCNTLEAYWPFVVQ